jgi:O-antigen/teichoic acid export membrane protein
MAFVIAFMVLLSITLTIFEPLMLTAGRVKEYSIVELMFNVMFFFSVAIPVFLDKEMTEIIWWLAGQYFIQSIVVLFFALSIAFKYRKENKEGEETSVRDQISYTLPIGVSSVVLEMSRYVDKMVVSNQSSAAEYALYVRGAMEIPVIGIIANTLDNLLMPQFVKAYKEHNLAGIITSWHRTIRLMAMFIYPSCLFLILSAGLLIPAIFSDKYVGSVIIFQIYTVSLLSRISTFDVIMRAIGQTKYILWISLASILFNVVFTYLFMQYWGLVGAPIATVITLVLMRLAYLISITRFFHIGLKKVFPWRSILSSLMLSIIASIPAILIMNIEFNDWLRLGVMALAFSATYLVLLKHTDILTLDDKALVKGILPKVLHWAI